MDPIRRLGKIKGLLEKAVDKPMLFWACSGEFAEHRTLLQPPKQVFNSTPRKKGVQVPESRGPALISQMHKSKRQALFITFAF